VEVVNCLQWVLDGMTEPPAAAAAAAEQNSDSKCDLAPPTVQCSQAAA
jgi:hypothetical protein